MLSKDDYRYLYGKLNVKKIPSDISNKIDNGEEFTKEEELLIKKIIDEDMEQNKNKKYNFVSKEVKEFKERALCKK